MLINPGEFLGKRGQQWGMNLAGWYFSDHLGVSAVILVGSSIELAQSIHQTLFWKTMEGKNEKTLL